MIQELAASAPATAQAVSDTGQLISSQLAGAALMAYVLQWVKRSRLFPWVSEHTVGIQRALTAVTSLLAAIGIHYSFDSTAGVITITGIHAASIAAGLWEWAKQWAFQQGAADMIFTKTASRELAAVAGTGSGSGATPTSTEGKVDGR
jgi:hypothetical protein